jgi:Carbohydrate binding module (family 6)
MPTTVYRSRSRTTRNWLLIAAAVVVLVMIGFLIGRAQGSGEPAAATVVPSPPASYPPPSSAPAPAPTGGRDAYQPLQVEDAAAVSGIEMQDTDDEGGGRNAGWITNGDWLRLDEVNFGAEPPAQLNVRLAADVPDDGGGRLEIRLDSPDAEPAATLETSGTGGWQSWRTEATGMGPVTGLHTVFVTFGSDRPDDFLNVNWLVFRR